MIFRRSLVKDIPAVYAIMQNNFANVMSHWHSAAVIKKFKMHNTMENLSIQMGWKEMYVIEKEHAVIATASLADFSQTDVPFHVLSNFFVSAEYHRQGIGTWMFDQILREFKKKESDILHVPSSRNAVGFYIKMGFTVDEKQDDEEDEITWMTKLCSLSH